MKKFFGRNTIKRSDIFVIFLTLLLIFSTFLVFRPNTENGRIAVITVDGTVQREIDLTLEKDCIFHRAGLRIIRIVRLCTSAKKGLSFIPLTKLNSIRPMWEVLFTIAFAELLKI